jgi:pimeloyl-ACP methyl ester carboxylesterase
MPTSNSSPIGFSIGAFVALQTSRFMRSSVQRIHLISAAAPLEIGDYLPHMAGKPVFQLAQSFPKGLSLLSHFQRLLARHCPTVLFRMLFASAAGADKVLAGEPAFQTSIARDLQTCFSNGIHGYLRDVKAYVRPWAATLAELTADISIWHGAQDNWSPPAMADGLASNIQAGCTVEIMDGLSHYSCLYQSAHRICAELATTDRAKSLQTVGAGPIAHP